MTMRNGPAGPSIGRGGPVLKSSQLGAEMVKNRLMAVGGALPIAVACCGGVDPGSAPVDPAVPAPIFVVDEATYLALAVPDVDPPTVLVVILEAGPMLVAVNISPDGQSGDVIEQGPAERCATYGGTFHPYEGRPGECDGVDF